MGDGIQDFRERQLLENSKPALSVTVTGEHDCASGNPGYYIILLPEHAVQIFHIKIGEPDDRVPAAGNNLPLIIDHINITV